MYRGIRSMLAGLFAVLTLSTIAMAADLPSRRSPAVPVFAQAYEAPFSWSGLYVGVNAGYGWSRHTLESASYGGSTYSLHGVDDRSLKGDGATVGATVGYNFHTGSGLVVGVEGDLNWSDFDGSRDVYGVKVGGKVDYFGTARVRLGYAFDRFLPYVTGGALWTHSKASADGFGYQFSDKQHNWGWVVGAGVEYAFTKNWSAKVEYLHGRVADASYSIDCGCGGIVTVDTKQRFDVVRAGLNYRF